MPVPCLVIAPVGEAWFRAALPTALDDVLDLRFVKTHAMTIDGVVAEVDAARGGDDVVVFGHSANGLLAFAYAATHPATTRGVLAIGTPPAMPVDLERSRAYWDAHAEPDRKARFEQRIDSDDRDGADALRRWYDVDLDTKPIDTLAELDGEWVGAVLIEDAGARDWRAVRAAVRCPVLLGLGAKDFVVPPTLWDGEERFEAGTVVVFERSGHQPFHDEPAAFVDAVAAWLP